MTGSGPLAQPSASAAVVEGLRERKKAKTRHALEDAAIALFQRQGFERTTVEQIADACEVSPRTFFRYFASKEEVLFGDSADKLQQIVAVLEHRPAGEAPLESMRAATLSLVDVYEGERDRRKVIAEIVAATPMLRAHGSERQDEWNDLAVDILMRSRGGAGAPGAFEVRLAVAAATGAVKAAIQTWLEDASTDLRDLIERAFDQLAAGLAH
jgi:AcrR family transcriptional regulator